MTGVERLGLSVFIADISVTLGAAAKCSLSGVEVVVMGRGGGALSVRLGDSGREVTSGEAGGRFFSLVFGGGVLLVLLL